MEEVPKVERRLKGKQDIRTPEQKRLAAEKEEEEKKQAAIKEEEEKRQAAIKKELTTLLVIGTSGRPGRRRGSWTGASLRMTSRSGRRH